MHSAFKSGYSYHSECWGTRPAGLASPIVYRMQCCWAITTACEVDTVSPGERNSPWPGDAWRYPSPPPSPRSSATASGCDDTTAHSCPTASSPPAADCALLHPPHITPAPPPRPWRRYRSGSCPGSGPAVSPALPPPAAGSPSRAPPGDRRRACRPVRRAASTRGTSMCNVACSFATGSPAASL